MNGFIMADELSIFDLTEADGRAAVIAWGKQWPLECPKKARPTDAAALALSAAHTHTHTAVFMQ